MSDDRPTTLKEAIGIIWGKLMIEKHYPDAMLASLLGYFIARSRTDKALEGESLSLLLKSIEEFRDQGDDRKSPNGGSPVCSFCARKEPEVRLVAGGGGFICNLCVQTANDVLAATPSRSDDPDGTKPA